MINTRDLVRQQTPNLAHSLQLIIDRSQEIVQSGNDAFNPTIYVGINML